MANAYLVISTSDEETPEEFCKKHQAERNVYDLWKEQLEWLGIEIIDSKESFIVLVRQKVFFGKVQFAKTPISINRLNLSQPGYIHRSFITGPNEKTFNTQLLEHCQADNIKIESVAKCVIKSIAFENDSFFKLSSFLELLPEMEDYVDSFPPNSYASIVITPKKYESMYGFEHDLLAD